MLVHLPIGVWFASFIFDILYFITGSNILPQASYACIGIGILGAILAAAAGLIEFSHIKAGSRPREIAAKHMLMNVFALGIFVVNFVFRQGGLPGLPGGAFVLSLIGVAILSYSGYLGGKLAYEYGLGSNPIARDPNYISPVEKIDKERTA